MIRTFRPAAAAGPHRPAAPARLLAAVLLGAAVAAAPLAAPAAAAAGSVTITLPGGASAADPAEATSITVAGRGFQSVAGGFGGVYVLFGWVSGEGWAPSSGGQAGADYRYVPDSQSKDNAGYERFVAFPGGETESAANGVLAADGSFVVDLTIPSARFEAMDRSGALTTVDCLEVQCGVITLGAHGVKNASNESFTPVSFAAPAAAPAAADAGAGAAGAGAAGAGAAGAAVPGSEESTAAVGTARVGYTASSAVAGNALSFTGQGFAASEQVVATLDDGVVAVGPLTAGTRGEVAGVLPLPADLRGGTHLLTLMGAASGASAQSEVTVVAAAAPGAPSAPPAQEVPVWLPLALGAALLIAAGLVLASAVVAIVRAARRRRTRRGSEVRSVVSGADPALAEPVDVEPVDAEPVDAASAPAPVAAAPPLLDRETADAR